MAEFEFGQAVRALDSVLDDIQDFTQNDCDQIRRLLYESQLFVQEGFATYMEVARLRSIIGASDAMRWARANLHPDYLERFERLVFSYEYSARYRDYFSSKLTELALGTGIRKNGHELDVLKSAEHFKVYLTSPHNNPNTRMERMLQVIEYKPWLLTRPLKELAEACDVEFYDPATKEQVADYLTYLHSRTSRPFRFTPGMIGDALPSEQLLSNAFDNLRITNLNLDIRETSLPLFDINDFRFYSDVIEVIFYSESTGQNLERFRGKIDGSPDVCLMGFRRNEREKYITTASRENSIDMLNNDFRSATQLVKQKGFDIVTNVARIASHAKIPDAVIYNKPKDMEETLKDAVARRPELRFKYRHIRAMEEHPFQMLWIVVDGQEPLHVVNHYGNAGISSVIEVIRGHASELTDEEIIARRKHLNNLMVVWMNMPWEVDWISSMIDGRAMRYRVTA